MIFFAHGDWGKSGFYDNDVAGRRRLGNEREHMHVRGGEGGDEYDNEEEHDHDHDEEHEEHEEHEHKKEEFWQGRVARSMLKTALNITKPDFILALGDNFYTDGVASTNDSMWYSHFRNVYFRTNSTLRGIKWYPVIGNHDLGYGDRGVQAQVDRTNVDLNDDDGIWTMPSTNYTFKYYIPGSSGFVQVVAIDTTWLAPSENEATDEASTSTKLARLKSQLSHLYKIFKGL